MFNKENREIGFISREKPNPIDWPDFNIEPEITLPDNIEVEIVRSCMFFHEGQQADSENKKITLRKLREFFAPKAIKLLEKDGYIKFNIRNEQQELYIQT